MRWIRTRDIPGDIRERTFFAWWPVTIRVGRSIQTRWLERVYVRESYYKGRAGNWWETVAFLDN